MRARQARRIEFCVRRSRQMVFRPWWQLESPAVEGCLQSGFSPTSVQFENMSQTERDTVLDECLIPRNQE